MKKNRLFLGLGTLSFAFVPVVLATSCKSGDTSNRYNLKTDIGNIKGTFGNSIENIKNEANKIRTSGTQQEKDLLMNQPIIQITTAGKVTDNSFNQMTWEAISRFSDAIGVNTSTYTETKTTGDSEMFSAYNNALTKGYKIWVLTGWSHESPFSKWVNSGSNKQKLIDNKIKIVSIDWDSSSYTPEGQSLSLSFKTQESSFLIGYSVAKFLGETFSGNTNKDKRIINASAGADGSGSTNFIYGLLEGVRRWNDDQNTNNDKKVSVNVYKPEQKIFLNTSYQENNPDTREDFKASIVGNGKEIFKEAAPTIVMPVAGDWSRVAANIIKEIGNDNKQWVIGVDSNMAISYGPAYSKYFITSSEKRIGIAAFKALAFLTGLTNKINDEVLLLDKNDKGWKLNVDGKITHNDTIKSFVINGGIDQDLVGASKSTIENQDHAKKFDQIIEETKQTFFGPTGKLEQEKNTEKINNFILAQSNPGQNNENYNKAVFDLKNVLYGFMSTNNNGFFNMIVEEINKWLNNAN